MTLVKCQKCGTEIPYSVFHFVDAENEYKGYVNHV